MVYFRLYLFICFLSVHITWTQNTLHLRKEIRGSISPKSIVSSGNGLFSAQNMMYRHSVTIYDTNGELKATIKDKVKLSEFGFEEYKSEWYLGGPVESCFSHNGKYLWVSNYSMVGKEFSKEGCDACVGQQYDPSFVYKINTTTFEIENIIKVGAVPKFIAINEQSNKLLVTNWTSSDVSIIDLVTEKEIKRLEVGRHPRGIAITKDGLTAYITIMGSSKIAKINLETYKVNYIENVGKAPRHLVLSNDDKYLFCSVNSANLIVKINLLTNEMAKCITKSGPRTMVLSANQSFIYVVNYFSDSFQKIDAQSMKIIETVKTAHHPIGIAGDWVNSEIWVSCYAGKIMIFTDTELASEINENELIVEEKSIVKPKIKTIPVSNLNLFFNADKKESIEKQKIIKDAYAKKEELVVMEEIESVNKKTEQTEIVKSNNLTDCTYYLIIGSFGQKSNAMRLKDKMKANGYDAQLLPSKNNKMTMVSIQSFSTSEQANTSKRKILTESNQKGWIFKN